MNHNVSSNLTNNMTSDEVIESFVTEVAQRLPKKQRNDVAFELRALLKEEVQGKAEELGREPDGALALEYLRGFGAPAEVAARYQPTLQVIDPTDGPRFVRATMIGLVVIWGLGLWEKLSEPFGSGWDILNPLSAWWGGVVIPSLWWPGVLVVGYGLAAWSRRRSPHKAVWTPRENVALAEKPGGRVALGLGVVGILCGLVVLIEPRWILDLFWGGNAAPVAYQALTYTESFRARQGPVLLGLLILYVPLYLTVLVAGQWTAPLRRLEQAHGLALFAAMVWTVLDGPVFAASNSDQACKGILVLILLGQLVFFGLELRRKIRPAPSLAGRA